MERLRLNSVIGPGVSQPAPRTKSGMIWKSKEKQSEELEGAFAHVLLGEGPLLSFISI